MHFNFIKFPLLVNLDLREHALNNQNERICEFFSLKLNLETEGLEEITLCSSEMNS